METIYFYSAVVGGTFLVLQTILLLIGVGSDTDTDVGELYDFADDRLPQSGWNWNLVNNDQSVGVHNPTYANNVLDAATDAMEALLAE